MISFSIIVLFSYTVIFLLLVFGTSRIKEYNREGFKDQITFSIIVPFRNEAHNLSNLLSSISALNYDALLFELILVNDESIDSYEDIIGTFQKENKIDIQLIDSLRKSRSPKKDAIDFAISGAKYEWIITTDADCSVPSNWLRTLNDFILSQDPDLVVMPISYINQGSSLEFFQSIELLGLQTATIGGFGINIPFLCNGANLAYKKNRFLDVQGFTGNDDIASGDDIFILEKMLKQDLYRVRYLKAKDVIVKTSMENKLENLYHQRIRWAAKSRSYKNFFGKIIGLIVLLMNLWLLILIPLSLLNHIGWNVILLSLLIKMLIDLSLVYPSSSFHQEKINIIIFILGSIVYPFYSVIIATASFATKFEWKGRTHSK